MHLIIFVDKYDVYNHVVMTPLKQVKSLRSIFPYLQADILTTNLDGTIHSLHSLND